MVSAATGAGQTVAVAPLRRFINEVCGTLGVPPDDAAVIADGMVWAELRGIDLGTRRLPTLAAVIRGGGTKAAPARRVIEDSRSLAVLDADDSWGQPAAAQAMRIAISKARDAGVGACVVRNTGNSLAMGYYPSIAIGERLVGAAFTNSLPLQAPWGGLQKVISNQAFAIGAPAARHTPLLFDSATTAITWAGIHEFIARGERLPDGLAVDTEGRPTTDPAAALAGRLLPMGGHRGFGIALMWEVLTGILSGGEMWGPTVRGSVNDRSAGQSTFLLAIDPTVAMPYETFTTRVDDLIDQVHASPPAAGVGRVYVPGERSAEMARTRERDGVTLSAARVTELRTLGESCGVPWLAV
jgi:LDH2 family malate/lactate/ureidoglycolate dehydrogenase